MFQVRILFAQLITRSVYTTAQSSVVMATQQIPFPLIATAEVAKNAFVDNKCLEFPSAAEVAESF